MQTRHFKTFVLGCKYNMEEHSQSKNKTKHKTSQYGHVSPVFVRSVRRGGGRHGGRMSEWPEKNNLVIKCFSTGHDKTMYKSSADLAFAKAANRHAVSYMLHANKGKEDKNCL